MTTALDSLEHDGLLSDLRFSEQYLEARRGKGYGPLRIRRELRERGVVDGLANHTAAPSDPAWRERADAARRRKFGDDLPREYRDRARQARFLEYRGFTHEQVQHALDADGSRDE